MARLSRIGHKRVITLLLVIILVLAPTGCMAVVGGGLQGAGEARQENVERTLSSSLADALMPKTFLPLVPGDQPDGVLKAEMAWIRSPRCLSAIRGFG